MPAPRLFLAPLLLVLGLLAACTTVSAQNPSYTLSFDGPHDAASGSTISVESRISIDPGANELSGITLGICHDPSLVAPVGSSPGPIFATINQGGPAGFLNLQTDPTLGVTFGVVVCLTACATLTTPQFDLELFTVDLDILGPEGATATLEYCDSVAIGGNPVPTILVDAFAGNIVPVTEAGTISILEFLFLRSDCDGGGNLNIGDAIFLLGELFNPSGNGLPCEDACDVNDDAGVNIADAIFTLQFLFGGGVMPPAPFPDCGSDPTGDALGCVTPPTVCP